MSKPVMYIFANQGLRMSPGKLAAQVAHAAVNAYRLSVESSPLYEQWLQTGYTKIILAARDEGHLRNIQEYLTEKDFLTAPIIDEGRTEVEPHSFTALGVEVVDKEDPKVQFAFGEFTTYREPKPEPKPNRWPRIIGGRVRSR